MKYELIASVRVLPDKENEVLQTLFQLAESSRKEPGCERWDLYRDKNDPSRIIALEVYRDEAAFREHLKAAYTQEALPRIKAGSEGGKLEIAVLGPVEI